MFLGILLSISTFHLVSQEIRVREQESRITSIQTMTETLFKASPGEIASDHNSLSKKSINLSDYVAVNGFRGLPVIIINNDTPGFAEWDSRYPDAAATYNRELEAIKLRDTPKSYIITLRMLQHEYGHHLWKKTLNEKERDEYRNIYSESSDFVTSYSLTDTEEDFAESYTYYKLELPLPETRHKFMENLEDRYPDEW